MHNKMSMCKSFGKDKVMFVTKEDHATPSTIELPPPEPAQGLITTSGDINWSCPCLGGMATGPCGVEFREAFSCFHYSDAEPKGSDCYNAFRTMQDCFTLFPTVYNKSGSAVDDDDEGAMDDMANLGSEALKEIGGDTKEQQKSTGGGAGENVINEITSGANEGKSNGQILT